MDDIWLRMALIAGVLVIAGLAVVITRWRSRAPVRAIDTTQMSAGVYFFSSTTCSTCDAAREKLDAGIGHGEFTEIVWEQEPDRFEALNVEAVPAVLIVSLDGRGRLYPGQPEAALRHL